MRAARKIQKVTVNLPAELLERARKLSGKGITETVTMGLQLVAAKEAYEGLRALRGKLPGLMDWKDLKYDRT